MSSSTACASPEPRRISRISAQKAPAALVVAAALGRRPPPDQLVAVLARPHLQALSWDTECDDGLAVAARLSDEALLGVAGTCRYAPGTADAARRDALVGLYARRGTRSYPLASKLVAAAAATAPPGPALRELERVRDPELRDAMALALGDESRRARVEACARNLHLTGILRGRPADVCAAALGATGVP